MPDEVTDQLQREVRIHESLHAAVTQRVRPRPRDLDPRLQQVMTSATADRGVVERRHRRERPKEHPPISALRAAVLEVIDQRLAHRMRERERGRVTRFARRYREALVLSVDVIERQRGDLATAKTVGRQQQQDRPVALADRSAPIHAREHPTNLLP